MALSQGMDMFFGMTSIIHSLGQSFDVSGGGGISLKNLSKISPTMIYRLLRAKYISQRDNRPIKPSDLFTLQSLVCVGTDTELFKADLEAAWGRRPLEVMGGTEPSCMATETWSKDGLVFFPDTCFYEFIPEQEMLKSLDDPTYQPQTYLMDEISANENYEIVITVLKGGSFLRYRVGDIFRCVRLKNPKDELDFPQFQYVDRIPTIIDIAGFTRITEDSINSVIQMSNIDVQNWIALKKYDENKRSYMQMYVELGEKGERSPLACSTVLREHLSVYFKYHDTDYKDLKHMLGIEPLSVTLLPRGTIQRFEEKFNRQIRKINPSRQDEIELLRLK
jgi:phenylacetate-coenzyme A ligase PaaK-like adenylate-forming protein